MVSKTTDPPLDSHPVKPVQNSATLFWTGPFCVKGQKNTKNS